MITAARVNSTRHRRAPPCQGFEASEITSKGHFGDVSLDGVRFAATFRWPGPLHEGGGIAQLIVDPSASEEQRSGDFLSAALIKILSGEEQEPTTVFNIWEAVSPQLTADRRSRSAHHAANRAARYPV